MYPPKIFQHSHHKIYDLPFLANSFLLVVRTTMTIRFDSARSLYSTPTQFLCIYTER